MNKARNGNGTLGTAPRGNVAGIGSGNGMNGGMNGTTMPLANGGMNGTENGRNGMNGTAMPRGNGTGGSVGGVTDTALLEKLRALSFVKTELELYLDTHPDCPAALDYYRRTVDELGELMEQYQMSYGPLIAAGGENASGWDWVKYPWPWQRGDEKMWNNGTRGGA